MASPKVRLAVFLLLGYRQDQSFRVEDNLICAGTENDVAVVVGAEI